MKIKWSGTVGILWATITFDQQNLTFTDKLIIRLLRALS